MSFNSYNQTEVTEKRVLTDDEKKLITDDFVAGKSPTEIKHSRFIPTNLVEQSFKHKKETEVKVIALMKGEVIVTPEVSHYDEETGEKVIDTEVVYNTKPDTLSALKVGITNELPTCTITDYNVDAIVESATEEGTFEAFKAVFEV